MNSLSRALVLIALAAAAAGAKVMEDTVATVNGVPIMLSEYQKEVATAIEFWARSEPESVRDPANLRKIRESTLEELINRELLFQEGQKQKIKVRERDVENGVMEIKSRFLSEVAQGREPTEAEKEEMERAFKKQLDSDGLTWEQFRARLNKQIMARKLIDEVVRGKAKAPEEADVKAYFERIKSYIASKSTATPKGMDEEEAMAFRQVANQVKTLSSERVRVARILVRLTPNATTAEVKRASTTAEAIYKKLLEGNQSFSEAARAESEDPESAARGGDIGYLVRGVAPKDFEAAAFALPVGEISKPLRTDAGFHIIRVAEKRAAEPPDFERFKDDLAKFLSQIHFQNELDSYVKALKGKAVIERNNVAIQ